MHNTRTLTYEGDGNCLLDPNRAALVGITVPGQLFCRGFVSVCVCVCSGIGYNRPPSDCSKFAGRNPVVKRRDSFNLVLLYFYFSPFTLD